MRPAESFLGQPIRSLQTMLRVLAEQDPSYKTVIPDGIYGPETAAAVAIFQRKHGLGSTGVTDQATWETIVSEYEPSRIRAQEAEGLFVVLNPGEVIRPGQRHPVVFLAQGMLAVLSEVYGSIPMPERSGLLDRQTADALEAFQSLSRLPMTGALDKVTWKHLALQYPLSSSRYMRADLP